MAASDDKQTFLEEEDEENTPDYCCMHVSNSKEKLIKLTGKGYAKFKEIQRMLLTSTTADEDEEGPSTSTASLTSRSRKRNKSGGIPGYHTECYSNFCNITKIKRAEARDLKWKAQEVLEPSPNVEEIAGDEHNTAQASKILLRSMMPEDRPRVDRAHVLPPICIICKRVQYATNNISRKRRVEKLVQCETIDGGCLKTAETLKKDQEMLLKIHDKDLVAIEAKYHRSCYLKYTRVCRRYSRTENPEVDLYCQSVIEQIIIKDNQISLFAK
ncbi:uncharacterized protein [Antedon mediterranea]|uniref:uncharacterized protein n=1 Tax=Antedon mediterranea TaxID=105859 RepID=UPI003AF42DAF